MAKYKSPSELSTKTIRITIGDYVLLKELSRRLSVTMAEALHLTLERQEAATRVSPAQIPMPAFRVAAMPVVRVAPVTTIATNGSKAIAFKIKPKGVRHD